MKRPVFIIALILAMLSISSAAHAIVNEYRVILSAPILLAMLMTMALREWLIARNID